MNNFWKGLSNTLYFLGFLTLVMELIVFTEFGKYIDSPYWALGASVIWLLFVASIIFFVVGANLKYLPIPEKFKNKSVKEILEESNKNN